MFESMKEVFIDLVVRSDIEYFDTLQLLVELHVTDLCLGYPSILSNKYKVQNKYNGVSEKELEIKKIYNFRMNILK